MFCCGACEVARGLDQLIGVARAVHREARARRGVAPRRARPTRARTRGPWARRAAASSPRPRSPARGASSARGCAAPRRRTRMTSSRTSNSALPGGREVAVLVVRARCARRRGPACRRWWSSSTRRRGRCGPSTMKGTPGSVPPTTLPCGVETCARYHSAGACRPRCGSLASSGLPLTVRAPSTTQLLEPTASSAPGDSASIAPASGASSAYSALKSGSGSGGSPGYGGRNSSVALRAQLRGEAQAPQLGAPVARQVPRHHQQPRHACPRASTARDTREARRTPPAASGSAGEVRVHARGIRLEVRRAFRDRASPRCARPCARCRACA